MKARRVAEIAGGGFAGLTMSILLARQGWQVRVHERNESIREVGAGIFLRDNPYSILDSLGIMEGIRSRGVQLTHGEMLNSTGRVLQRQPFDGPKRLWIARRQIVISAIERAAREAGVTIECDSRVVACEPSGVLRTADGAEYEADLIIGADGHTSPTRKHLNLTKRHDLLSTVATRYIVPGRAFSARDVRSMYWSGRRRVGIAPCDENSTYLYLICPASDSEGVQMPIDVASWSRSFPVLGDRFHLLAEQVGDQHPYNVVQCTQWHSGRVVLLGDAAHAQPPTLGQGAGMALTNACTLSYELGRSTSPIPETLADWDRRYRPATDTVQSWSIGFDNISNRWPRGLTPLRSALIWGTGHVQPLKKYAKAADGVPLDPQMLPQ